MPKSIFDQYLGLPWTWRVERDSEDPDTVLVTIAELPDFFAAGDTEVEAFANARDALISHLEGYLTTGRRIPTPEPHNLVAKSEAAYPPDVELVAA